MIRVNSNSAPIIAKALLDAEAVKLSIDAPFTWASGWKSPIYCDNRLTLAFPAIRKTITHLLAEAIKTSFPDAEVIAGVATAGIPQGALVAQELELPFAYVRSKPKGHGMTNLIEGKVEPGQKVVVIEDLISTGGSSLKAVQDLRDADAEVLGMAAIFTYGFNVAENNFSNAKTELVCLSSYEALLPVAVQESYIKESSLESLSSWRSAPDQWGR